MCAVPAVLVALGLRRRDDASADRSPPAYNEDTESAVDTREVGQR
jgi:hypothetical protein